MKNILLKTNYEKKEYEKLITNNKNLIKQNLIKILEKEKIKYENLYLNHIENTNTFWISYLINENIDIDLFIKNDEDFTKDLIKIFRVEKNE